jgi:hypothetical protein
VLGSLAFSFPAALAGDYAAPGGLTAEQAKAVLIVVLNHEGYLLNKSGMDIDGPLQIDPSIPSERAFWEFGLTFDSPNAGATKVLGQFAVGRLTGDVWETNLCKNYSFPSLKRLQRKIMETTKRSFADEAEARRGLGCQ